MKMLKPIKESEIPPIHYGVRRGRKIRPEAQKILDAVARLKDGKVLVVEMESAKAALSFIKNANASKARTSRKTGMSGYAGFLFRQRGNTVYIGKEKERRDR